MRAIKCLGTDENIERGMNALYKNMGPVEARRFLLHVREMPREDSVNRHRRWQARLGKKAFVKRIMAAQRD